MMVLARAHVIGALVAAVGASAVVSAREFGRTTAMSPGSAASARPDTPSAAAVADPADVADGAGASERGPVVWVSRSSGRAASQRGNATEAENATTSLALASLSASQLEELRAGLELLRSRLDARANPFGDDLEDGPPGEAIDTVRRSLAPALTAAHHLAARTQTSADGTFAIALGSSCAEAPAGASCSPLWASAPASASARASASAQRSATELRERAAFFAWPIASAAVVRFTDAAAAAEALDVMRERARSPRSRIAMALDERTLAGDPDPRVTAVREAARGVVAHLAEAKRPRSDAGVAERGDSAGLDELAALRPVAATPAPGRLVPWLTLAASEIMVVPKLGGLSDLASFASELDGLLLERDLDRKARWVRRPGLPRHQR